MWKNISQKINYYKIDLTKWIKTPLGWTIKNKAKIITFCVKKWFQVKNFISQMEAKLTTIYKDSLKSVKKFIGRKARPKLSSLIKQERKKFPKKTEPVSGFEMGIYEPSKKSFGLITGGFLLLVLVTQYIQQGLEKAVTFLPEKYRFDVWEIASIAVDDGYYESLLAVLGVIGGIVFALAIFIAESSRDVSADRVRIFLKESAIWPVTLLVILTALFFLWGDKNYLSPILILIVGLLSIISFGKIIKTQLNRVKFLKSKREFLSYLVQKHIDLEVNSRLADNILFKRLEENDILLQFRFSNRSDNADQVEFRSPVSGRIVDIDLTRLEAFSRLLEKVARRNNFTYFETVEKPKAIVDFGEMINPEPVAEERLQHNNKRFLYKKYNDEIGEDNLLVSFDRSLLGKDGDKSAEADLRALFVGIFDIREAESFDEEVRLEFRNLRDEFTVAINADAAGDVEEYARTYVHVAEGFLDQLTKYGGGFSYEQAKKERSTMFAGFSDIQSMSRDVYELLELAGKRASKEIVLNIAYIPVAIARRAIDKHDHYSFQEFIRLVEFLYIIASRAEDERIKDLLKDRSWRYLRELCNLYIQYRIEDKSKDPEDVDSYKWFIIHILRIYQNLLKASFEAGDYDYFAKLNSEISKLLEYGHFNRYEYEVDRLKYIIDSPDVDDTEKKKAEEKIKLVEGIYGLWVAFESRRNQMRFGMATFIFDRYQSGPREGGSKQFFDQISNSLSNNLKELTSLFLECHNYEVEDFWNWDSWDLIVDGGVQSIQILEKLEKFYVVKALQIISKMTDEEILEIDLPTNKDLVYLVDGSRELMSTLDKIQQSPETWRFVLSEEAIGKINTFRSLLETAKEKQKEETVQEKIDKPISKNKIQDFITESAQSFGESNYTVPFFRYLGLFVDKTEDCDSVLKEKKRLGINQVDEKAVFLEDRHEGYGGWGENYGESMARGLDREVFTTLLNNAEQRDFTELDTLIDDLGGPDNVVLVSTGHIRKVYFSDEDKKFLPSWDQNAPRCDVRGFSGWYKCKDKLVPVFEVYHSVDDQLLVVTKSGANVTYEQQCPLYGDESKDKIYGWFYYDIRSFSEDEQLLTEMVEEPPAWLTEQGGVEEQKHHLRQRVLIKIFMRYKLKFEEGTKLYKVGLDV